MRRESSKRGQSAMAEATRVYTVHDRRWTSLSMAKRGLDKSICICNIKP